jgi:uncharacterized protein (DUF1697 family)
MKTYVAMIRGINVTGYNIVKMERLRAMMAKCGFHDVRTYIQSGNVIFSAEGSAAQCIGAIERALARELGKPIAVLIRSSSDLAKVLRENPFLKDKGVDEARVSVSFLKEAPAKERFAALSAIRSGRDRYASCGKEIYLYCPDGFGNSKLAGVLERVIGVKGTVRNWNTVKKLYEMSIMKVTP